MELDFDKLDEQGMNDVRDTLFNNRLKLEKIKRKSKGRYPRTEQMDTIRAIREQEDRDIRAAFLQSEIRQSRRAALSWGDLLANVKSGEFNS